MNRGKKYKTQKFLNKKNSPSTGTICIYDGKSPNRKGERWAFVEIADCHQSARLHKMESESNKAWKTKLKKLVKELKKYIRTI